MVDFLLILLHLYFGFCIWMRKSEKKLFGGSSLLICSAACCLLTPTCWTQGDLWPRLPLLNTEWRLQTDWHHTQPHWPQTLTSMENRVPGRHQPSPCGGECLYQCQYIGVWGDDRKLSAGPSPVLWWRWWEHLRRCEVGKLSRKYLVRVKNIWCEHKISGESIKYLLHCIAV